MATIQEFVDEIFDTSYTTGETPNLNKESLTQKLEVFAVQVHNKAVEDCINSLPLRSDWDDDEKVTVTMALNAAKENLSYRTLDPEKPYTPPPIAQWLQ
jgi:hypothetical protein